jgi:murein tripeptide amidase MpaA
MRLPAAQVPRTHRLETVGSSVEGRNLLMIRFGNGGRSIFVDGTMHASEYICTAYIMYMLDLYAQAYELGRLRRFQSEGDF